VVRVKISQLTGRKYTSGKVLQLLALLTLHRNEIKNNDSIIEKYAYYVYIMRKLTLLPIAMCLGHERQIHSKPEDQRLQTSIMM
jgi:hypothetical protein